MCFAFVAKATPPQPGGGGGEGSKGRTMPTTSSRARYRMVMSSPFWGGGHVDSLTSGEPGIVELGIRGLGIGSVGTTVKSKKNEPSARRLGHRGRVESLPQKQSRTVVRGAR